MNMRGGKGDTYLLRGFKVEWQGGCFTRRVRSLKSGIGPNQHTQLARMNCKIPTLNERASAFTLTAYARVMKTTCASSL